MMNFFNKNKAAILGGVALVVVVYVYFTYFSGSSPAALTTTQPTVSQNLLQTLQNLHTIKLDASIFSDPVFTSLTDFGVTIPPENAGRPDPFAPLSFGASASGSSGLTLPGAQ